MSQRTETYKFGTLGRLIQTKLRTDNDAKVIIQAQNSQTGVGKTTLAIQLMRFVDESWDPRTTGAYWDMDKYVHDYNERNIPAASGVLLDEIEMNADSRRSMSNKNLKISQAWSRLRNRNVLNVATLPSISMLDKRLIELADFWILVRSRGLAQPYSIKVNDFTHKISYDPFEGDEHIRFRKIPKDDEDYQYVEEMKTKMGDRDFETITIEEHEKKLEKQAKTIRRDMRNKIIEDVYNNLDVSYEDITKLELVDLKTKTGVYQAISG